MQCTRLILILTLMLAAALPAVAQQTGAASGYDSAFAGYKAYQEPKVADWKATNAAVAGTSAHGHGAHAAPAADPHAGHDMSKMNQPATPAADPHAGHDMSAMERTSQPDPHAGHDMSKMKNKVVAKPARAPAAKKAKAAAKAVDPHAGHHNH